MGEVVPMPARDTEPWVSKLQLARHLGVSPRTIERWVGDGMPHCKLGSRPKSPIRFKVSEVEAWLGKPAA